MKKPVMHLLGYLYSYCDGVKALDSDFTNVLCDNFFHQIKIWLSLS